MISFISSKSNDDNRKKCFDDSTIYVAASETSNNENELLKTTDIAAGTSVAHGVTSLLGRCERRNILVGKRHQATGITKSKRNYMRKTISEDNRNLIMKISAAAFGKIN